jgi:hypothetical protein
VQLSAEEARRRAAAESRHTSLLAELPPDDGETR